MIDLQVGDRRRKRIAVNLFLLFIAVYLFSISGLQYNTDSGYERIELVKSIVERHELSLPKGADLKGADGRMYPLRGIAPALLSAPLYVLGKFLGVFEPAGSVTILNQIFGAATVVLVFYFSVSLGYSLKASLLTAICYGFGTFAWPYSKISFEHVIETFFVLYSVYCLYLYSIYGRIAKIFYSGISFGIAFNTRYTSALILLAFMSMMILHYKKQQGRMIAAKFLARDAGLFCIAFLPFLCLSFWYNFSRFGSVFETGYTLQAQRLGLNFFWGTTGLTGLEGFLLSPGKGFFYYSPVAILFFFSIRSFLKKNPGLGIGFICIILSYLLFLSKNIYWHGDWAWGPRYLLVITPFLIIPLASVFDSSLWLKKRLVRVSVYLLLAVSIVIQIAAVSVDFNKYFFHMFIDNKVKFKTVHGDGVMTICEMPEDVYFIWKDSPLLAQFAFLAEISRDNKVYEYKEPDNKAMNQQNTFMHLFDYWWWYQYALTKSRSGFVVAVSLLMLAAYAGLRIFKTIIRAG